MQVRLSGQSGAYHNARPLRRQARLDTEPQDRIVTSTTNVFRGATAISSWRASWRRRGVGGLPARPETTFPGPLEDVYAGLVWTAKHAVHELLARTTGAVDLCADGGEPADQAWR
jgi:hypothetical protein